MRYLNSCRLSPSGKGDRACANVGSAVFVAIAQSLPILRHLFRRVDVIRPISIRNTHGSRNG
jgi:hypothetical protein